MKSVIVVAMATLLFMSGNAMANSSSGSQGAKAASEAGPWIDCILPDGKVEYMPLMICKLQKNGKVK
ncbi:hypothetical protein PTW35_13675 [Photobacterium sp. DA100]|uniref:hypothetical protein n=1 Tax=Photobacterium sp. DA100 TaxID=3027472 RepID=UPI002478E4F6|nr:hypothetical protein [Photobacterium sp. DA100]WEM41657.1 hypothetical protein PTW35_13675 [Photobacterium sp. DA100]